MIYGRDRERAPGPEPSDPPPFSVGFVVACVAGLTGALGSIVGYIYFGALVLSHHGR